MRLVRICISIIALAVGSLAISATGAAAANPCAPGRPPGRPGGTGQPPGRPPQYPPGRCQLQLSPSSGVAGTRVTAVGTGFKPGTPVALTFGATQGVGSGVGGRFGLSVPRAVGLIPVDVGTATAGSDGIFTQAFTVPDATPALYEVLATGVDAANAPMQLDATFTVVTASNRPPAQVVGDVPAGPRRSSVLARTGTSALPAAGAGLAFVAVGGAITLAARRRRATTA